jgi:hypothetical protein
MPAYQSGQPASLRVVNPGSSGSPCGASSGDCREVPDISADASPSSGYVIYWNGGGLAAPTQTQGWQVVGGTSGAAPAWAAVIALANASAPCNGVAIGFANPALYHAAAGAFTATFNDVTAGENDMTGTNLGQYAAGSGYDMGSGLGSPNAAALAGALCTDAIALANPGAQRSVIHSAVSLQIRASDTRGAPVSYSATGLPAGLSINPATGTITGQPSGLGTSNVTIAAANGTGTSAQTTFAWTIQGKPTISHVSLGGVRAARPTLKFTLTAGRDAPALKDVSVTLPRGLHFSRSRAKISVTGRTRRHLRFRAFLRHGSLVLQLRTARQQLHVTISYPRLRSTGSLSAQVSRHRTARLTVTVHVTDSAALATKLSAKVRPRG